MENRENNNTNTNINTNTVNSPEPVLYQWQESCLRQWFANQCRGTVQAVTGSGKTLLALTAARRLEQTAETELRVKIVVPTETLMLQWHRALRDFLPPPQLNSIGLRGGGRKAPPDCKYMVYVINSARYELARQILAELKEGKSVLLIADECHHYTSGQNQLIFEFLPYIQPYGKHFFSLGLSATLPSGQAGRYLSSVLGDKIYNYGMAEASDKNTVCPYDIYHISLSFRWEEKEEYQELSDRMAVLYSRLLSSHPMLGRMEQKERYDLLKTLTGDKDRKTAETAAQYMTLSYKRKSLVCLASDRLGCAYHLVKLLGTHDKILIFSERIRQAEELYSLLESRYPGRVGRYHSQLGQLANKNALDRFRTGDIRILITCKAIDEGVDVPDATIGIILSGTSAIRQRIQRLGRIIRKKEGKDRASLYYLHITETSEDNCYLPDNRNNRIFELEYLPGTGGFYHPSYDRAASGLLKRMRNAHMETEKIKEAEHCLKLGRVRADWLSRSEVIETHLREATSIRSRNYWIFMKKLKTKENNAGTD